MKAWHNKDVIPLWDIFLFFSVLFSCIFLFYTLGFKKQIYLSLFSESASHRRSDIGVQIYKTEYTHHNIQSDMGIFYMLCLSGM